jgi:uncharacterized oligopeptide transporter (OPT) family protein
MQKSTKKVKNGGFEKYIKSKNDVFLSLERINNIYVLIKGFINKHSSIIDRIKRILGVFLALLFGIFFVVSIKFLLGESSFF